MSYFAVLLVVFKLHYGSEGVKISVNFEKHKPGLCCPTKICILLNLLCIWILFAPMWLGEGWGGGEGVGVGWGGGTVRLKGPATTIREQMGIQT